MSYSLLDANNADSQDVIYTLDSPASGEATVSNYTGPDGAPIVIPSTVTATNSAVYNVVKIGNNAMMSKNIVSVILPDSIQTIGQFGFYDCPLLTSIHIPANVTSIGSNLCTAQNMVSFSVDAANTSFITDDNGILYHINSLYEHTLSLVAVPAQFNGDENGEFTLGTFIKGGISYTVTDCNYNGDDQIFRFSNIPHLIIGDSVTALVNSMFNSATPGISTITVGNGITNLSCNFNQYGHNLTALTISASVTSIETSAFNYLTSLTIDSNNATFAEQDGILYQKVDTNNASARHSLANVTNVNIPANISIGGVSIPVTSIWDWAFVDRTSITGVSFGTNVLYIGCGAFSNTRIESVIIPSSVTTIEFTAFSNNISLTSVTFQEGSQLTTLRSDIFKTTNISTINIPDSILVIQDGVFNSCTSLTNVIIPSSVTSIDVSAFRGSLLLTDLEIDSNNATFAEQEGILYQKVDTNNAASLCGLASVTNAIIQATITIGDVSIPVTSILGNSFDSANLTSLTIGANVTSIANEAFQVCSSLTSVIIPDAVTSIGNNAFASCSGLTSVTIGANVTSISGAVFLMCSSLTSVTIGANVTSIGHSAFYLCSALISAIIPDAVTSISDAAFYSCSSLTSVTIGANVTSIGDSAFQQCSALISVTIPDSVTSIGANAFRYGSLVNVYFLGNNVITMPAGTEYDFFNRQQFQGIPPIAVAHYVDGKTGYIPRYSSDSPPEGFSNILTFVPEGSGSGSLDANNADSQGVTYTLDSPAAGEATVFGYSGSATSVSIPAQVSKSGTSYTVTNMDMLFFQSFNTTVLILPSTISYIDPYNIGRISNLTSLSVDAANPHFMVQDGLLYNLHTESGNNYATVWGGFNAPNIPNRVTVNSVTKGDVTYPVTSIHEDQAPLMFWGARSVIFGHNVTSVGGGDAFHSNTHIVSIFIMNSDVEVNFHSIGQQFTTVTILTTYSENMGLTNGTVILPDNGQIDNVSGGTVFVENNGTANINSTSGVFGMNLNTGNANVVQLNGSSSASVSIGSGMSLITTTGVFHGTLSGAGTLEKTSTDTLTLHGDNTEFSGNIRVREGTIIVTQGSALGTGIVKLGALEDESATLEIQTTEPVTLVNRIESMTNSTNKVTNEGGAVLTLTGGMNKNGSTLYLESQNGTIRVDSNITGSIPNSDLGIIGNVTLVAGNNTYDFNGPTTVPTGSTLTLEDGVSLTNSELTINSGATLVLEYTSDNTSDNTSANTVKSLTLNGSFIINISSNLIAGDYTVMNTSNNGDGQEQGLLSALPVNATVNYTGSNSYNATLQKIGNTYVVTIVDNSTPDPETEPTPTSNICFPAKTPVLTNCGYVNIEEIDAAVHTIRNKKIVAITKTVAHDKNLVRIAKHALGKNYPEKTTFISQNHKVFCQGQMIKAKHLVNETTVTLVPYNGAILYNVLLADHEKMQVNNLIVETLHPEHKVAKLYRFLKNVDVAHHGKLIAAFNKKDKEHRR